MSKGGDLKKIFLLKYNWFPVLCFFQVYSTVSQFYTNTYMQFFFFLRFFSLIDKLQSIVKFLGFNILKMFLRLSSLHTR